MKILAGELKFIYEGASGIYKERIPARLAFRLTRIINKITPDVQALEAERLKLLEKYAGRDGDGKLIIEDGEYLLGTDELAAFNEEFGSLAMEELEIDVEPLTEEDLGSIEALEGKDFLKMGRLIQIDEENEEAKEEDPPE